MDQQSQIDSIPKDSLILEIEEMEKTKEMVVKKKKHIKLQRNIVNIVKLKHISQASVDLKRIS